MYRVALLWCVCVCVGVDEAAQSTGETENRRCLSQTFTQELSMFVTTVTNGLNVAYYIFSVCACVSELLTEYV